jgi:hypothetical protein
MATVKALRASPRHDGSLGPAHEDGGCMRKLGNGDATETKAYRADKWASKGVGDSDKRLWPSYKCARTEKGRLVGSMTIVAAATKGALVRPRACPNTACPRTKNAWCQSAARRGRGARGGSGSRGHAVGEACVGWAGDAALCPDRTGRGCARGP